MQGVLGGEPLPAPAQTEHTQGVRGGASICPHQDNILNFDDRFDFHNLFQAVSREANGTEDGGECEDG